MGLVHGLILGIMSFLLIGSYLTFLKSLPAMYAFSVSFCAGAALLISILVNMQR